jgi:hypothetical protein
LIGALAGCASHPPAPVADLTRAHTLVAQAQTSDAPRYDSVDLAAAQDKLQQADSNAQSNPVLAGQFAQEASADAELSIARTRARKAQESLGQVNDSLTALRQQTNQLGDGAGAQADAAPQEVPATPSLAPQGGQ